MTDDESVVVGVQFQDVIGFSGRAIDTASLSDGVEMQAVVFAQLVSRHIDDVARPALDAGFLG